MENWTARAAFCAGTLTASTPAPSASRFTIPGLVADPTSTDLYAIQGAFIPSASPSAQRLLRLRRTAPDQYDVEVIAERFGKLSACGLAITSDGQRLVVTDKGNRVMLVLKRRDKKG